MCFCVKTWLHVDYGYDFFLLQALRKTDMPILGYWFLNLLLAGIQSVGLMEYVLMVLLDGILNWYQ